VVTGWRWLWWELVVALARAVGCVGSTTAFTATPRDTNAV
jgi:hypothetical protein